MYSTDKKKEDAILVYWKMQSETEIFSSLMNFCLCYPRYHYTTLRNYLSKGVYESGAVRVERKNILEEAAAVSALVTNQKPDTLRSVQRKAALEDISDWKYWLSQPGERRAEAATFLVMEKLKRGQRIDKTIVNSININL